MDLPLDQSPSSPLLQGMNIINLACLLCVMLIPLSDNQLSSLYPELLTGILLPTPYFLASLAFPLEISSDSDGPLTLGSLGRYFGAWLDETSSAAATTPRAIYVLLMQASWLASLTLLLLGALACWMHTGGRFERKDEDMISRLVAGVKTNHLKSIFTLMTASRILGIVLPYFAALQLGGLRTGLLLLLTFSSGIPHLVRQAVAGAKSEVSLRSIAKRKFSTLAVILSILSDAVGLTAGVPKRQLLTGYLALFASILIVPFPAFTGAGTAVSASTTRTSAFFPRSWIGSSTPAPSILSPLISTPQSGIQTFVAGGVLLVSTLTVSFFFPTALKLTYPAILLSTLTISSTAALAFFAQPPTLQSGTKLGVAAGCATVVIFDCIHHWSSSWKIPIICSIWPTWAYLAAFFDTVDITSFKIFSHDHHDHGYTHASHHTSHTSHFDPTKNSRLTAFLLSFTSPGSIMHTILIERDSRRIFYFAR